jgi:hypothetical protein
MFAGEADGFLLAALERIHASDPIATAVARDNEWGVRVKIIKIPKMRPIFRI